MGLAMALYMAREGVSTVLVEADETVSHGSRAIGFSQRSLEVMDALEVVEPFLETGLTRLGSRAYVRDREINFNELVRPEADRFPRMVNIQQSYVESFLASALKETSAPVLWSTRLEGFTERADSVDLELSSPSGRTNLSADWLIACDGARSTVRSLLGVELEGSAFTDRYLIVDIETDSSYPSERRIWFDSAANPGSTTIMHKQPDNVWRLDFRLPTEADLEAEMDEGAVAARVSRHLEAIGEEGSWRPVWISSYQARALTLPKYRFGRVLLAGDAAHLVPIFGARGMNSGLEDVDNLGWKLTWVQRGLAGASLLDTYTEERRAAALVNIRTAMTSMEIVAPRSSGARLLRDALLGLAGGNAALGSLLDPRSSDASAYPDSSLNIRADLDGWTDGSGVASGSSMRDGPVRRRREGKLVDDWLTRGIRRKLLALCFSSGGDLPVAFRSEIEAAGATVVVVALEPSERNDVLFDYTGALAELYAARPGCVYLIRPDGFVVGRWRRPAPEDVIAGIYRIQQRAGSRQ